MRRPMPCMLLAAALAAATAQAGVIRGVVRVPSMAGAPVAPHGAYPGRAGALPSVPPVVRGLVTDAVVSIARIPASAESVLARDPADRPRLAQESQRFVPRVLAVAVGTTVQFPNLDPIFHNVFSVSPVKRFDLGKYPKGHSRSVTFGKPGVVQVYCDIHSNMEAYVLVLSNHAFTRPDGSGAFALPDLPMGSYQLEVWHPDFDTIGRTVQVVDGQDARIEISF